MGGCKGSQAQRHPEGCGARRTSRPLSRTNYLRLNSDRDERVWDGVVEAEQRAHQPSYADVERSGAEVDADPQRLGPGKEGFGEKKSTASTTCPATSSNTTSPAPPIVAAWPCHDLASEGYKSVAGARLGRITDTATSLSGTQERAAAKEGGGLAWRGLEGNCSVQGEEICWC